jgi:membrane-associated protease RseP (regulator of RpoE activity)
MDFITYDIALLAAFVLFVSFFLYMKRDNLKREGLLFLYRTKWGVNLIDKTGRKYKKTLKVLSYVSIFVGCILMIGIVYLLGRIMWIYAFNPGNFAQVAKVPPFIPLVPYLPQIFSLNFLPPFYFTYWIIILAVIAISHEFSHGIFMRRYNIKIKSTGFGFFPFFFPAFPLAFVEQDEKSMNKSKKFHQMAVLSAGTFANILTALFFFIILAAFFFVAYAPSGVIFDTYAYSAVNLSSISSVNGIPMDMPAYSSILDALNETGLNKIETAGNRSYVMTKASLESQQNDSGYIIAYDDAPAINSNLGAVILGINGKKVMDIEAFREELAKFSPGDRITITTLGNETKTTEITLSKNPENSSQAFLGVAFAIQDTSSVTGKVAAAVSFFRKPHTYYAPELGEFSIFIYNLLWWLILISISVALVNMLPMGIFDGGRFFYLMMLSMTKSGKKAGKISSFIAFLLFFMIFLIIFFWFYQQVF